MKNRWHKWITITETTDLSPTMSKITLNRNRLESTIQKQRLTVGHKSKTQV